MRKSLLTLAILAAAASLAGCEGRKMSNMEPTGDTVEVVLEYPGAAEADAPADSVPASANTNSQPQ